MKTDLREYLPEDETQAHTSSAEPNGTSPLRGFTVWKASRFLAWQEPENTHLIPPSYLTRGELTSVIGQGGIGKSRLVFQLAIDQITQQKWCGLETAGGRARWLFLGNENSLSRIKSDLTKTFARLSSEERAAVEEHLHIQALVELDDGFVDLSSPETIDRLRTTIATVKPDVIVFDPLVNFVPGDISKPVDMKAGIMTIHRTVREAGFDSALIFVHHARTGRSNIAQGIGFDAANFALGAKGLFNASRTVIHLMPGAEDDDTRLVLSCGKTSNAERFQTRGITFNTETFHYDVDPTFDLDQWRDSVSGKKREAVCTIADVVGAVRNKVRKTGDIIQAVEASKGASKRSIESCLRLAVDQEYLECAARGMYNLGPKANLIP